MFKNSEEFKSYIMEHSGIYYDSEAHQLYVNDRGVSATIDCPYELPDGCDPEDYGTAFEEMAEGDDGVWIDLFWEYESEEYNK